MQVEESPSRKGFRGGAGWKDNQSAISIDPPWLPGEIRLSIWSKNLFENATHGQPEYISNLSE